MSRYLRFHQRVAGPLFWLNLVMAALNLLAMVVASRIPVLAPSSKLFALGALGFAVGMIANYFMTTPRPTQTK
jgi:hypothetical protein